MIQTYEGIVPVRREWDELADRTGAPPFLRPGWIEAWWEAFGRGRLRVLAAREGGRLVAVMPVARRAPVVCSPTNWHTPVFGPVAEDRASVRELIVSLLSSRGTWLDLAPLDSGDSAVGELAELAHAGHVRVIARTVLRSPYIRLEGGWPEYEASLSREVRQQARKRRRRLERLGRVEVTFTTRSDRWDELLTEGFAVEGSGWKAGQGTAISSRVETERFYRQVALWAAARGTLHLGHVRFDGECVAFLLSFSERGTLYTIKAGFDTRYSRYAPGAILTRDSIEHAYEQGMSSYEFLGDADPYKIHWARQVRERVRLQAFPPSVVGAAGFVGWRYARPLALRARPLARRAGPLAPRRSRR